MATYIGMRNDGLWGTNSASTEEDIEEAARRNEAIMERRRQRDEDWARARRADRLMSMSPEARRMALDDIAAERGQRFRLDRIDAEGQAALDLQFARNGGLVDVEKERRAAAEAAAATEWGARKDIAGTEWGARKDIAREEWDARFDIAESEGDWATRRQEKANEGARTVAEIEGAAKAASEAERRAHELRMQELRNEGGVAKEAERNRGRPMTRDEVNMLYAMDDAQREEYLARRYGAGGGAAPAQPAAAPQGGRRRFDPNAN